MKKGQLVYVVMSPIGIHGAYSDEGVAFSAAYGVPDSKVFSWWLDVHLSDLK